MANKQFEIKFLFNGKALSLIVDNSKLTEFYQNKLEAINIISVKTVKNKPVSKIEAFLKPKKSIWSL